MAAFLIPKKELVCFVSLLLLCFCFTFYTLKLERTKPDTGLSCHHLSTNVAFIKTHKTASTSVMHLFSRYANKYQRLFVFFKNTFSFIQTTKFHRSSVLGLKPGYNYSVFAQHTIFDYDEMRAVMPDDTKYVTILREPVTQFQSAYDYYHMESLYGMNISTFAGLNISDPQASELSRKRANNQGINQMAFDLGIDPALFESQNDILRKIQKLDKQFDLVMITELFDESVILMKEIMCWKAWDDVISFKINVRRNGNKAGLSSEQKENVRRMNRADQLIYDHFYQKLLGQIDAFGKEKMEEEVRKLRAATKMMYAVCVGEESTLNGNENTNEIEWFELIKEAGSHEVCADLTEDIIHLMASMFSKQKPFFSENEIFLGLIEIVLDILYLADFVWDWVHSS